jgi:hypothetical protein
MQLTAGRFKDAAERLQHTLEPEPRFLMAHRLLRQACIFRCQDLTSQP